MLFLKRARPLMKEKVFPTVPLIKDRASGRVSCTEAWNCSQILNVKVTIVMMLVIMIIHLTILTLCRQKLQQSQMMASRAAKRRVLFEYEAKSFRYFWVKWVFNIYV